MIQDPYSVLGVSPGCSEDELKSAYRKLAKQYHPDLHPGDAAAAEKMNEINAAYEQIKNPPKTGYQSSAGQNGYTAQNGPFTYTYYSTSGGQDGYDPFADFFRGFEQQNYSSYRRTVRPGRIVLIMLVVFLVFRLLARLLFGGLFGYGLYNYSYPYGYSSPYSYSENNSASEQARPYTFYYGWGSDPGNS